jgi:UPF0755 protein
MKLKISLVIAAVLILALISGAAALLWRYAHTPLELKSVPVEFDIKPGSTLQGVAEQLTEAQVLSEPWKFTVLARALEKSAQMKAGHYRLEQIPTPLELIDIIAQGRVSPSQITILEGWTFRQLRALINQNRNLTHESEQLSDGEILQRIGAAETHPEGLFFPDTYAFDKGSSDLDILKRAYQQMALHLNELWANRAPDVPFQTPYEALIMASIVEKETGRPEDRSLVAAVFVNRLKFNMKLQADPTVIYGLGEKFDGNLRKTDLVSDHPYNTYYRTGLPPTPIAMPGLESLKAVLNPPDSEVLYFVSRGDGTSHFSESLTEHNKAVAKYQKKQRPQ